MHLHTKARRVTPGSVCHTNSKPNDTQMKTRSALPRMRLKRMSLAMQTRARLAASVWLSQHGMIPRAACVDISATCDFIRDIADGKQRIMLTDDPKVRLDASRYLRKHVPGCLSLK